MNRRLLALLVALALAPSASAAFLQAGVDAARTGVQPDAGPEWGDLVLSAKLPGGRVETAAPLIIGGEAYVLVTERESADPSLSNGGVYAVDLETGAVREVVRTGLYPNSFAADDTELYVVDEAALRAVPLAGGPDRWTTPLPRHGTDAAFTTCVEPAVHEDLILLGCVEFEPQPQASDLHPDLPFVNRQPAVFVLAVEAATGTVLWKWTKDALSDSVRDSRGALPRASARYGGGVVGLSVVPPRVLVTTIENEPVLAGLSAGLTAYLYGIDLENGWTVWAQNTSQTDLASSFAGTFPSALPTGRDGIVYARLRDLRAINAERGTTVWSESVGAEDASDFDDGAGFALSRDSLYTTSPQTIYRVDLETRDVVWSTSLPRDPDKRWGTSGLVLADGILYARSLDFPDGQREPNFIHAIDAATGETLWVREFDAGEPVCGREWEFAVADGVAVAASCLGHVHVLGRTAASPALAPRETDLWPAPGTEVEITGTPTRDGLHGPIVQWSADWGDGTVADWQTEPTLRHTYAEPGEYPARLRGRNAAGQETSAPVAIHVGGRPPDFFESAFARENQDLTFFVLGLAATAIGGGVGLTRLTTRRRRLARELTAIDQAHQAAAGNALRIDAALAERRARARALLLDGKLDEAQVHLLERRIDELSRNDRLHELGDLLDQLPRAMARAVEEMLADGRITSWERKSFLAVLEQDRTLTDAQKTKVRALVEDWFARDAGRGRDGA